MSPTGSTTQIQIQNVGYNKRYMLKYKKNYK